MILTNLRQKLCRLRFFFFLNFIRSVDKVLEGPFSIFYLQVWGSRIGLDEGLDMCEPHYVGADIERG